MRYLWPLSMLIVFGSFACAFEMTAPVDNDENGDSNNGEPTATSIDFVIENQLDRSVYVQMATEPSPGWLSVLLEGSEIYLRWDCELPCACDETQGCMDCGMAFPYVQELQIAEEMRMTWDGRYRHVVSDNGSTCFEEIQLTDQIMDAEFCYGNSSTEGASGQYIESPICETIQFHFGFDEEVVMTIESDSIPPPPHPGDAG